MEPVKRIEVNGHKYTLRLFGPLEAFEYVHAYQHAMANRHDMTALGLRAVRQCNNEMGRSLAEPAVFEEHFNRYPGDMFELELAAQNELARPFVKNADAISGSGTA